MTFTEVFGHLSYAPISGSKRCDSFFPHMKKVPGWKSPMNAQFKGVGIFPCVTVSTVPFSPPFEFLPWMQSSMWVDTLFLHVKMWMAKWASGVAHHALVNFANRISRFLLGSSPVFSWEGWISVEHPSGDNLRGRFAGGSSHPQSLVDDVFGVLVSVGCSTEVGKMRRSATTMRCRKRKMRWWTKQPVFFSQIGCKECAPKWINVLHFGNVHWGNNSDFMDIPQLGAKDQLATASNAINLQFWRPDTTVYGIGV